MSLAAISRLRAATASLISVSRVPAGFPPAGTLCRFQLIAHRGACGKARVVPHNRRPGGIAMIERYVLGLEEIDKTQAALVGGKGAHLGELSRIEGIRVPVGFCVTTDAFLRIMTTAPWIDDQLDRLSRLDPDDRQTIRARSAEIRRTIEGIAMPDDLAAAITRSVTRLGGQAAYAVRSSATAEDLPTTSFAGQQDTYLNVVGIAAILQHVSRCWAALFTDRAVTYRVRNGFDHRKVHMAVVVQQMLFPQAAGVLFTADPVTSNRKVVSIEASFGLGEALAAGLVNADVYKVRDGEVVAKAVATKELAIHARPVGGTQELAIEPESQEQPALTDEQIVRLAQLGRRIEAHFGHPQDIEWCLVDDGFQIVQSRPITTLFPIPAAGDQGNHVYVSVGHQQMMTDPMKPLGLSVWQLTALRPMTVAGGRLFVDVTRELGSPAIRAGLLKALGTSEPLIGDALQTILDRGDFIPTVPDEGQGRKPAASAPEPIETDPAIVAELIERSEASIATLQCEVRARAARLHPRGHPGAEADPDRSAKPPGVHVRDASLRAAQRPAAGVAGREERSRHAHAVRPPQRHLGNGTGAPGRRGRDPPVPGGSGIPAACRGRELPGRAAGARRRPRSPRRHPGLHRQVRHALRRRDRHHEATLERTPQHARAHDPRQHQELRAGRGRAALRARPAEGLGEGTGTADALAGLAGGGAEG